MGVLWLDITEYENALMAIAAPVSRTVAREIFIMLLLESLRYDK